MQLSQKNSSSPLYAHESPSSKHYSSSSRSTCSILPKDYSSWYMHSISPKHNLASSIRSKDLHKEQENDTSFEPMPQSYDGSIFEHDDDEQQKDPRNTLERTLFPLGDPYDVISEALLDYKLIIYQKNNTYGNPFLETYYSYH